MFRYFNIAVGSKLMKVGLAVTFLILISTVSIYGQKAQLKDISVDDKYLVWYSYVIDSTYLGVHTATGDLPRRANGTYLYWKADQNGQLIPVRKIKEKPASWTDMLTRKEKMFYE